MLGNVWEWVEDYYTIYHSKKAKKTARGPLVAMNGENRVKKGGSFLCHHTYCYRYRIAARYESPPDSANYNVGFRCAMDADNADRASETKPKDEYKLNEEL